MTEKRKLFAVKPALSLVNIYDRLDEHEKNLEWVIFDTVEVRILFPGLRWKA